MFTNTKLFFLKEDIFKEFGKEKGKQYMKIQKINIINLFYLLIAVKAKQSNII